jgi:hypothetical protein
MWLTRGDPLYADKRKKGGLPPGVHLRKGYIVVTALATARIPEPLDDPRIERKDRIHAQMGHASLHVRDGDGERTPFEWNHRKVAGAKAGEIVHHIDGDPIHNDPTNLHVFADVSGHALAHRSLEKCAYALLAQGLMVFDRKTGLYRLDEQQGASSQSSE